jgi:hypothetical protein
LNFDDCDYALSRPYNYTIKQTLSLVLMTVHNFIQYHKLR